MKIYLLCSQKKKKKGKYRRFKIQCKDSPKGSSHCYSFLKTIQGRVRQQSGWEKVREYRDEVRWQIEPVSE